MEDKSKSKRFIDTFVHIEMFLKKQLNKQSDGFTHMIHQSAKTNSTIKHYLLDLIEYAQLRNAIIHNRSENNELIAEPHIDVVEKIEKIYQELINPKTIMDLNLKAAFTSHPDESATKLAKIQEKNNYSIVPIYEDDKYIGIVHSKLYQSAYAQEAVNLTVRELLAFHKDRNRVIFMSKKSELREIVKVYFDLYEKGKGIIGVIISENGFMNEPALAMITPADLANIFELLE